MRGPRPLHVKLFLVVSFLLTGYLFLMQQQLLTTSMFGLSIHSISIMKDMLVGRGLLNCKAMQCMDFAAEMSKGYWRSKKGLSDADFLFRKEMDKKIRIKNQWPANLYRDDARCGKKFPLPGYRIQSLCNPDGPTPCCDTKIGECGISESHCKCPECTDLREFQSAELLDWVADNAACSMKNFTKNDACDFLNKHKIHIAFIGDSLIRHLSTTMFLLLSGNTHSGSLPLKISESDLRECTEDFQLTFRDCSLDITAHDIEELPPNSICDGEIMFQLSLVQDYGSSLQNDVIKKVKEMLGQINSYIVLGVGLHYGLNSDEVIRNFLGTITRLIENGGSGWPRIIWMEIHSLNGFLRMETKFHNDRIGKFNEVINQYLNKKNITHLRTFEKSKILKSYDGQHYGIGFNMHKIQMILNYLEVQHEAC